MLDGMCEKENLFFFIKNLCPLLVRAYTQLDRSDGEGLRLYNETLENMKADGKIVTSKSNLTFILDAPGKMNQISCGFGAFLSYGAAAMEKVVQSLEATGGNASAWKGNKDLLICINNNTSPFFLQRKSPPTAVWPGRSPKRVTWRPIAAASA